MSPERSWERVYGNHPDHLATAEATLAAVYPDSRNPFAHPELLDEGHEPWTVPQLWVQQRGGGNVYVDMTDVYDRKLAALLSHESQIPSREWAEMVLQGWGQVNAESAGCPEGPHARAVPRRRRHLTRQGTRLRLVTGARPWWVRDQVAPESSDCHTSPDAVPNAARSPRPSSAAVSMLPVIQSVTRSNGVSPWIDVR